MPLIRGTRYAALLGGTSPPPIEGEELTGGQGGGQTEAKVPEPSGTAKQGPAPAGDVIGEAEQLARQ